MKKIVVSGMQFLKKIFFVSFSLILPMVWLITPTNAQELDVAFVPTPDSIVQKMLDMANVGMGDYLIDLGCGDGRINIAAAQRGALGHGVDLDPKMIKLARNNAKKNGVDDKVFFIEENIYDTDFSQATVIAMYLFPDINIKLRPGFLNTLKPGTRIVSHDFGMDEWKPDKKIGRMDYHAVLLWIVPAKVEGTWIWQTNGTQFIMKVKQKFQEIEPILFVNGQIIEVLNSSLSGKNISFTLLNEENKKEFVFSGRVDKNEINGFIRIHDTNNITVANWKAFRK